MIRSFSAVTELFLSNLAVSQKRSEDASNQVSSGYRVNQPSDSPDDVVTIMDLQTKIKHAAQVRENLTGAVAEANSSESALETAVHLLDQVDVIGVQALGIAGNSGTRSTLATQVEQLMSQLVGLTQLNINGKYVFSGDNDQQVQYTADPNPAIGYGKQFSANQTTQVLDIFGGSFKPSMTAAEIFDQGGVLTPTANNVFNAVQQLYNGLMDANPVTGAATMKTAVGNLQSASVWLNNCLSFYGAVQNRLALSENMATQYSTMWTVQLGTTRDTDVAAAATELTASKTQQQAAMAAYTSLSKSTLFDYIK